MSGIVASAGKSAKQLAVAAAKKAVQEPAEILKAAGRQISGMESLTQTSQDFSTPAEGASQEKPKVDAAKLKVQGQRQLQALESEIQDIRRAKLQEEMERQQAGQQAAQEQAAQVDILPQGASKPSRKMMGGLKAQIKKFSGMSKAEMRKPPSG